MNIGGERVVHLLPSEPYSVITTVNQILTGQQFNVKGAFVSTVSTPATSHIKPSPKAATEPPAQGLTRTSDSALTN